MSERRTNRAINDLKIRLDRSVPNPLAKAVPDHMFMLPAVVAAVAKRNSGKTTAFASLLRDYHELGLLQRCWLISPNANSAVNKELFRDIVAPEDVFTEPTWASVNGMLEQLRVEADDWRAYLRDKEDYKAFKKQLDAADNVDDMPIEVLIRADERNWLSGPPEYKYGNKVVWPSFAVVIDDAMNTQLFAPSYNNPLNNAALRNRHIHGVGLTMLVAVQSYSSQNGLPRSVRENATVFMLWRQASEERRKQIAAELSGDIDSREFLRVYDDATPVEDSHAFLCIDFQAPGPRRFRSGFNRVVEVTKGVVV